ncbi:hypothetical protein LTR54_006452 [Friedmanniomyces endolithicus]|nr:hypothetical protein LTR54_006452 [Friedmanniomyces endolithicus]
MAHTSRFYVKPVSQAFAEKAATDGLCGDVSHTVKCVITECTLPKCMAVRTTNASYSILHTESVPGMMPGREPRRLAPSSQSRGLLFEARLQLCGVGAAMAGVDRAISTSRREPKATAALEKPAAADHRIAPSSTVSTAMRDQVPTKSGNASKAKFEQAAKAMTQDPAATTLEPKFEADGCKFEDEDDWEVVDRPEEEAQAKVSFCGRFAGRFFGTRLG